MARRLLTTQQLLCCTLLLATGRSSLGFQSAAPHPTLQLLRSRADTAGPPIITARCRSTEPWHTSSLAKQFQRSHSRLYAFGGPPSGNGFSGGFGVRPPNPPIQTFADVLQRIQQMVVDTVRQFVSGFTKGYLLALVWEVLRGPSLTVASRPVAWGLDFGVLAALFTGTNSVAQFVLALPTKKNSDKQESEGGGDDTGKKSPKPSKEQNAMLWSSVGRNMILALYFGRDGGPARMARSAALYGVLTYVFVRKKVQRDARQGSMFGGNINGGMGSVGGMGSMGGGQASQAAMQQLLVQMVAQNGMPPPTGMGVGAASSPRPPQGTSAPRAASSPNAKGFDKKKKKTRDDAVDVEFERTGDDDDEDDV